MTSASEDVLPRGLPRCGAVFDHVAHAAPRLTDLLPLYRDVLGGRFFDGGDVERVGYRAVQLVYADESRIELMEPLPGSHFLDRFFERNPSGGLHHVTFRVPSLDDAIEAAQALGLELVGEHRDDPEHLEVFVHPRSGHGTVVQLFQGDAPRSPEGWTLEALLAGEVRPSAGPIV
jgi:methylmalonyl-CoA/ethylmalonyl-CoA epimerase